jgi:tetratricopeptide (TPR) repeat protein
MPSLADNFGARPETVADLETALVAGAVVGLVSGRATGGGQGGWLQSCGKTQLAVGVAESMWRSREVELLVWVVAASRASVLSGFAEAAVDVMGAGAGDNGEAAAGSFVRWLGETSRPWLVVLDDLRDTADLEGLWPEGPAGRVLITAADPAVLSGARKVLIQPVGVFSPSEALHYLVARLAADADGRRGAEDLAGDLGYEPLALAQASAVIASSALSCGDYRDLFVHRRQQIAGAVGCLPPAASVTWAISAEQADRLSPAGGAQSLLALASLLGSHGTPGVVFATPAVCHYLTGSAGEVMNQEPAREALRAAERAGLLSADLAGAAAMVRMNAGVQTAIRAAMPAGMIERATAAAADALLEAWPADEQPMWLAGSLRLCAASLQHVTGGLLWMDGCHPLLLRAGRSLHRAGLTGPAVAYQRGLASASDQTLGRGHPDTLAAGERLAAAALAAGQGAEAVAQFRWVLAERVRVLGPDHPSAIATRRDLGHALVSADQFGDAVTVLDRVVGDYERICGADQPETLGAQDELAAACLAAGRLSAAITLYRRTLSTRERTQGLAHPDTVATRQKLADAYLADGSTKAAISHYKRVLADRERLLGPDDLATIAIRGTLGSACRSDGRIASALQFYEQSRAGYERVLGADHRDTLTSGASLADAYYAAGRVTDAVNMLRGILARCEEALPPSDPLTQAVQRVLASIAG